MSNVNIGPALPPGMKERQQRGSDTDAANGASKVPIGPPLPPGLKQQQKRRIDTDAVDGPSKATIGPPLPPGMAVRNRSHGAGAKGTPAADSAALRQQPPPNTPVVIGPPLPPGKASGAAAAPVIGPPLPPGMAGDAGGSSVIGPALPPDMARRAGAPPAVGAEPPAASRKREWDRVRSAGAGSVPDAGGAGDEGRAAHPGDEGREEWMTVAPVFDKRQSVLAAQGLGGLARAPEGPKRPAGPPRRPGDAAYEARDGGDSDSGSDGGGERVKGGGGGAGKRVKYSAGPSLLEQHVSGADEVSARRDGQPRYRQFDREKEFTDHKKRDASFYAKKAGGLGARYGPARGGDK